MRVTGGDVRGRRLKSPAAGVRPTSDRVREAIFNALDAQGVDCSRVLDLYAGSGALGIEGLSRGAAHCDFVERDRGNCTLIQQNLEVTGLTARGRVYCMAVERAAERLTGPYSLILADPPYGEPMADSTLAQIASSPLAGDSTVLVLEHSARREPPPALARLQLDWHRGYGDSAVAMYRSPAA